MSDKRKEALLFHQKNTGKIRIESKVPLKDANDLSLAYSPGVAVPCEEIYIDDKKVYDYTSKGNMVAVITDGTAVLGLGDIGVHASLPVMEGKCLLFKKFAGLDAFPILVDSKDPDLFIQTVYLISKSFGGINLEDISSPRCVTIERKLIEICDVPVFHDDQHGTAIVTLAAVINAMRLLKRDISKQKIVICGVGAAGNSIARLLHDYGAKTIYGYNSSGIISKSNYDKYNFVIQELLDENIITSFELPNDNTLSDLVKDTDIFIGVSVKDILTIPMVDSMNPDPIILAMANPNPEISLNNVTQTKAIIYGTGRSDYPNQINNCLAFPGIFKGALEARSTKITEEMKVVAAEAIAFLIKDEDLKPDYIVPSVFDKRVAKAVAKAVKKQAIQQNICRE